jgi:uncharacterized protein (UPF0335 family)
MADSVSPDVGGIAADQLRSIIERYERLQEEVDALRADQKEVLAEAKGNGFDVKTIRKIIALRKKEENDRREEEALLDLYKHALGLG